MSDYATKLAAIAEKKQKLLDDENRLVEQRKQEIGQLAERLGLLTVSDALITGLFITAQNAIKEHPEQIKQWEQQGGRFLQSKSPAPRKVKASSAATTTA